MPPSPQEKNRIKSPKKTGREGESHNSPYFDPVVLCIVTGHPAAVRLRGPTEDSTPGQNKHAQKPVGKKKFTLSVGDSMSATNEECMCSPASHTTSLPYPGGLLSKTFPGICHCWCFSVYKW